MLPVGVNSPVLGSYNSDVANTLPALLMPPDINTSPLFSSVAVCAYLATLMLPVAVKVPVEGLYSSAEDKVTAPFWPPVVSTIPLFSRVAVCRRRAEAMLPVDMNGGPAGAVTLRVVEPLIEY